ncbi:hypothetical protein JOB18_045880 [Solea senegalensis]|uniref:Uncharacterized protein n=1 Tax=Solea senegalensis TaxID=28829 RepID=A0AAV6RM06_SOLSE|nr:hypothetical protein JOB18_045880 [Solea senegalensis]
MHDFIEDLKAITTTGVMLSGKQYNIALPDAFICDTPAKAFLKCIKGHGGYSSCERCTQYGIYVDSRVVFPDMDYSLRTDTQFEQMSDEDHHRSKSPLQGLGIATYAEARVKLHQAEYTSDLTDTEDSLIKRKARATLQSQSKQLESSEDSDTEDEIPPTPPEKHLRLEANKMTSRITSPTAQQVARSTVQQVASPTAQRVASSTVQQFASPTAQLPAPLPSELPVPLSSRSPAPLPSELPVPLSSKEIKETQKVHGKMLNVLLKKEDASVMEVPDGVVFLLQTQADVEALEEKLGERSLMSAVLALDYNMFGCHGKKKFKDFLSVFSTLCMRLLRRIL